MYQKTNYVICLFGRPNLFVMPIMGHIKVGLNKTLGTFVQPMPK
jgi:hypothetical protein